MSEQVEQKFTSEDGTVFRLSMTVESAGHARHLIEKWEELGRTARKVKTEDGFAIYVASTANH